MSLVRHRHHSVTRSFRTSAARLLALAAICSCSASLAPSRAEAIVFDLASEWSDAANPNGAWAYRSEGTPLPHVASTTIDTFPGGQAGWGTSIPFFFRSTTIPVANAGFPPDWQIGDVVVHTAGVTSVTWTSPMAGVATVTGGVWMGRNIGRSSDWVLLRNGVVLTSGHIADGDPYSRAVPFLFSLGSGGAAAASGLAIVPGAILELRFLDGAEYVGVTLQIDVQTSCGDGSHDAGEACDDGNFVSGDGCDANCRVTACGNWIVTSGEVCDDGNLTDGDGCDSSCTPSVCGNGIRAGGEVCDDGNLVSGDGCDANCTPTACRNGVPTAGEACDDGNAVNGDGCRADCTAELCGDGIPDPPGEQCDDGNGTSGDGCDANCTPTGCGNGIVTPGEECDDRNATDDDMCSNSCRLPVCGDGVRAGAETCDDGNTVGGDGCSSTCLFEGCAMTGTWRIPTPSNNFKFSFAEDGQGGLSGTSWSAPTTQFLALTGSRVGPSVSASLGGIALSGTMADCDHIHLAGQYPFVFDLRRVRSTYCGDGVVQPPEACDDGNWVASDGCHLECNGFIGCGNGAVELDEQCDDGNAVDDDACSNACRNVGCGDGVLQSSEECDDGNVVGGDGCDASCRITCGNGVVDPDEQCDQGPDVPDDCCSPSCTFLSPRVCRPAAAPCDADEWCSGSNGACPGDAVREAESVCGVTACPGGSLRCDGVTSSCPADASPCRGWDLREDWSDTKGPEENPNGPWVYTTEGYLEQIPFAPPHGRFAGDVFPASETVWGADERIIFKSDGLADFELGTPDWSVGDVLLSSRARVTWTSPIRGRVRISGRIWNARAGTYIAPDDGLAYSFAQSFSWFLQQRTKFGHPTVHFEKQRDTTEPYVPFARARPSRLVDGDDGNGVPLDDVEVSIGDVIYLDVSGQAFDYLGVRLSIEIATCGDGVVQEAEICDDGNAIESDGCTTACTPPRCGDGWVQAGEECDDRNTAAGDGCGASCAVEPGWLCSDTEPSRCSAASLCGDGAVDRGETCDDGGSAAGDGCSPTCEKEAANLDGSWQLTVRCGSGPSEEVTTSRVSIAQAAGSATVSFTTTGCPTVFADGTLHAAASCVATPDPVIGEVAGSSFALPSSGVSTLDVTLAEPYASAELACSTPRLLGRVVETRRLVGTIQTGASGTPARVDGTYSRESLQSFDSAGAACAAAAPETCSFTLLRADVAAGSNVTVAPLEGTRITFGEVEQPGTTTIVPLAEPEGALPPSFQIPDTPVFFDVQSDATPAPGEEIEVCLPYPDVNDDGFVDGTTPPIDETALRLLHDEDGTFVDRTSRRYPVINQICARVDHFSQFTVAAPGDVAGGRCGSAPRTDCRSAGRSSLAFNEGKLDKQDSFSWTWQRGQATTQAELGDPTRSTDYAACIYAGPSGTLLSGFALPAGASRWSAKRTTGYAYKDKAGAHGGITGISLRGGAAGKANVTLKGKGARLPDVARPVAPPVLVQLINLDSGLCWGASYAAADVKTSDGRKLSAVAQAR